MSSATYKAETQREAPNGPSTASSAEPSMEEILASIRRIIADDQAAEAETAPEPGPPPRAGNDDVLDLAEFAQPRRRPQPFDPAELERRDAVDFVKPDPTRPDPGRAEPPRPAPARHPARPAPSAGVAGLRAEIEEQVAERLVSRSTDESVGQAFHLLANTMVTGNARTLEDIVREMLRPMLRAWLDDNLPVMVERLVRAEIERVARGR